MSIPAKGYLKRSLLPRRTDLFDALRIPRHSLRQQLRVDKKLRFLGQAVQPEPNELG